MKDELAEDHLEADRDAPRVDDQAEFSELFETRPVGALAHLTVGLDLELDDQSGDEVHADVREQASGKQEKQEGHDSDLIHPVRQVEHARAHRAGQQCKDRSPHGSRIQRRKGTLHEGPLISLLRSLLLLDSHNAGVGDKTVEWLIHAI